MVTLPIYPFFPLLCHTLNGIIKMKKLDEILIFGNFQAFIVHFAQLQTSIQGRLHICFFLRENIWSYLHHQYTKQNIFHILHKYEVYNIKIQHIQLVEIFSRWNNCHIKGDSYE